MDVTYINAYNSLFEIRIKYSPDLYTLILAEKVVPSKEYIDPTPGKIQDKHIVLKMSRFPNRGLSWEHAS